MEFMGIGPLELLLILVIALIVFGPGRLPEIAAKLGRFVNNIRQASFEMTRELTREIEASKRAVSEVAKETKEITKTPLLDVEDEKEKPVTTVASSDSKSDKETTTSSIK